MFQACYISAPVHVQFLEGWGRLDRLGTDWGAYLDEATYTEQLFLASVVAESLGFFRTSCRASKKEMPDNFSAKSTVKVLRWLQHVKHLVQKVEHARLAAKPYSLKGRPPRAIPASVSASSAVSVPASKSEESLSI